MKSAPMSDSILTRDNLLLSGAKFDGQVAHFREINVTRGVSDEVAEYVRESLSRNTQKGYLSDLAHFEGWGGQIPASPETIAEYLVAHADVLSVATLNRRLAALSKVHRSRGFSNPITVEIVTATLRGLKRIKGTAQRQATPLIKEDLFAVLEAMGSRLKDCRDRALLLLGFAGGFRRSELVGLNCNDVAPVRQGLEITLRRSKTDQNGAGRKIGIPRGRGRWCPVVAFEQWQLASGITEGPIFRPIDRHHRIGRKRLSGDGVCLIIREGVRAAAIDPKNYSGHSLRAGLATSAAMVGVSSWKIRQQTGHASDAMLSRYIRDGELFTDNAAGAVL
jgi:integrase